MVRPAEQANTTNPAAERRFDSKVIFAFIAGAVLLLLIFFFIANRFFADDVLSPQQQSTQTQESDKRAAP